MEYRFGKEKVFIKESIFKWLGENKNRIGIQFVYDKDYKWEDINKLYAIAHWFIWEVKDKELKTQIIAVLYKCKPIVIGEVCAGIRNWCNRMNRIDDKKESE